MEISLPTCQDRELTHGDRPLLQCRQLVELQKDLKSSTEKMLSGSQQSANPAAGKNDTAAEGQGKSGEQSGLYLAQTLLVFTVGRNTLHINRLACLESDVCMPGAGASLFEGMSLMEGTAPSAADAKQAAPSQGAESEERRSGMELDFSPPVLTSHKGVEHGSANRQALP